MSLGKEATWRKKYEECEAKRKDLVRLGKKATRDYEELRIRYNDTIKKTAILEENLREVQDEYNTVKSVCETVYYDYQSLKTKYNVEIDALQESFRKASEWYTENRILKRQSQLMVQHIDPVLLKDISVKNYDDDEFSRLLEENKGLQRDNAAIQVEVNQLKLQEFENLEQIINLEDNLAEERSAHNLTLLKLKELKNVTNQFELVSKDAISELTNLQNECNTSANLCKELDKKYKQLKREKAILAHKSALLSSVGPNISDLSSTMKMLDEMNENFDKERRGFQEEIESLRSQLATSSEDQVIEEKLKFYEEKALIDAQKFEEASNLINILEQKVKNLEMRLKTERAPLVPAPPPPPPPMPGKTKHKEKLQILSTLSDFVQARRKCNSKLNSVADEKCAIMSKVLSEIKSGNVKLRETVAKEVSVTEELPIISELESVMASLRRINTSPRSNAWNME